MARLIIAFLLFVSSPVFAGDFYVNLYGVSHHTDSRYDFNEDNQGYGIRYAVNDSFFIEAGRYLDSLGTQSKYAGAGVQTNLFWRVYVGVEGFVLDQPYGVLRQKSGPMWLERQEQTILAALPFVGIRTGPVTTTVSYIPKNERLGTYEAYIFFWSVAVR